MPYRSTRICIMDGITQPMTFLLFATIKIYATFNSDHFPIFDRFNLDVDAVHLNKSQYSFNILSSIQEIFNKVHDNILFKQQRRNNMKNNFSKTRTSSKMIWCIQNLSINSAISLLVYIMPEKGNQCHLFKMAGKPSFPVFKISVDRF